MRRELWLSNFVTIAEIRFQYPLEKQWSAIAAERKTTIEFFHRYRYLQRINSRPNFATNSPRTFKPSLSRICKALSNAPIKNARNVTSRSWFFLRRNWEVQTKGLLSSTTAWAVGIDLRKIISYAQAWRESFSRFYAYDGLELWTKIWMRTGRRSSCWIQRWMSQEVKREWS